MDETNRFTAMQQRAYDADAKNWTLKRRDPVVGSFDAHNRWEDYETFLFTDVITTADSRPLNQLEMLDFGCGPGRNIVKFNNLFKRIDGVDICTTNLRNAELWIAANHARPGNLIKNNGVDLRGIHDNSYEVIMSTICFQHISVYDIRKKYLNEFLRVLRPGGTLTMQMGYGGKTAESGALTVPYRSNELDIKGTNGFCLRTSFPAT